MSGARTGIVDEAAICGTPEACERVAVFLGISGLAARQSFEVVDRSEVLVSLQMLEMHVDIASRCRT